MRFWFENFLKQFIAKLKSPQFWGFVLVLGGLILYGNLTSPRSFQRDPGYYWTLRETFIDSQNNFSLLSFNDWMFQLRGYFFPLLLLATELFVDFFTPDWLVDDYLAVVIFNAVQIALIGWFLIPKIYSFLTGRDFPARLRVIFLVLFTLFWRGLLHAPYSDLPAFFFFLVSALFYMEAIHTTGWRTAGLAFLVGVASVAAYLIRPVYLMACLVWLVGMVFLSAKARFLFQKFINTFAFLLATVLMIAPQAMINKIHYGLDSPFTSGGLYGIQFTTGFLLQRFDVNIEGNYPYSVLHFLDLQSVHILQRENHPLLSSVSLDSGVNADKLKAHLFSTPEFIGLFLKYHLDMTTIYFRHLFNGLNPMYPSIYVWNLRVDVLAMWLNYTVLFGVLFLFDVRNLFQRSVPAGISILLAWLLPVLAAMPGAVEARFFLPLHTLLLASFVWMLGDVQALKIKIERLGWMRLLFLYGVFVLMAFSLSGLVLTTVPGANLLLTPR